MDKIYFVLFDVQKNRRTHNFMINLMASTADDAKGKARQLWTEKGNTSHQFHLYAKRSGVQIPQHLHIRDFTGADLRGYNAMNRFICTDVHSWPSSHSRI